MKNSSKKPPEIKTEIRKSKVKSIIILADIERNEKLLLKNITYDNILINIYQVLQNSKLFKNCKT